MGLDEHIRKVVGRPRLRHPLDELWLLNENLRSLSGGKLPEPDARNVRKLVGKAQPGRR